VKTTKEQRDELDAKVLTQIKERGAMTFSVLVHRVPAEHDHREIDRSLQRLRKAKAIQFSKGAWRLA